jgi:hypothetical protein
MSRAPARLIIDGMTQAILMAADTTWPDAAIAIAGVALVGSVVVVVIWQALATWRARIDATRDQSYRRLADQMVDELHEINERLGRLERSGRDGGER